MTDDNKSRYRRPPKETQFKPGISGNPRGRPKATAKLESDLARVLNEHVKVHENGRVRKRTSLGVILKRLVLEAAKGNLKASAQLFKVLEKFGVRETASTLPPPVSDNDRAIIEDYLSRTADNFLKQKQPKDGGIQP